MTREAEIGAYRKRWEDGDFRAIIDAFEHFQNWDEPLPDWVAGPVHYALRVAYEKGGAPGKGKTGGFSKRAGRLDVDWRRWLAASACLVDRSRDTTEEQALEQARAMLAGTPAQGSPDAIKRSYYRVKRQLRNSA